MSVTVRVYRDAAEYLADLEPWLLEKEDHHNAIISVAHLLASGTHPFREPIYLASAVDGHEVIGCALAAAPDGLELTEMPPEVAASFVASVAQVRPVLPAVGGTPATTLAFARAWTQQYGGASQLRHNWSVFRLDEVAPPAVAPGHLRLGEESDWPWISQCAPDYTKATNTAVDVSGFLQRRLRRRELHVWDHDGPKSIVTVSGNTPRGVRISGVYTPVAFRGRGYASNAVATASAMALDAGADFCVLFADREPAQPARIYRAIGYRPIRDHLWVDLIR